MQKFYADAFFAIAKYLADVRFRFNKLGPEKALADRAFLAEGSGGHKIMKGIQRLCDQIGLRVSTKCIDHIFESKPATVGQGIEQIGQLERTILWEMEDKLFMFVPPERAKRYDLAEPFGSDVAKNFPSAAFDAKEAGNC